MQTKRNLTAVWNVFRGRREAIGEVDASFEGFWRSFLAVFLLVPLYVPYVIAEIAMLRAEGLLPEDFSPASHALLRTLSIAADWLAFPLLMLALARPLGISRHYGRYIAAHNWSSVIVAIPLALPGILFGFGLVSGGGAGILLIGGLTIFARMRFLVARAALDASVATAAGLVVLDLLLGLALAQMFDRLAGL